MTLAVETWGRYLIHFSFIKQIFYLGSIFFGLTYFGGLGEDLQMSYLTKYKNFFLEEMEDYLVFF